MYKLRIRGLALAGLMIGLAGGPLLTQGASADEQKFDLLQIGAQTYRNVTVTTKTKDYVFVLHSTGMANIKVRELTPEVRHQLGYVDPAPPKSVGATANEWAKKSIGKIETPQVKVFEKQLEQALTTRSINGFQLPPLTPRVIWPAVAGFLAVYLFFSYACLSLCRTIGKKPGPVIWLPVLKMFPLLDAAGMSAWWFLALLIPGLNLLAGAVWCISIAKARGSGPGLGILLMLPVINVLVFLYLAFGSGAAAPMKEKKPRVQIMTLETA